MKMKVVKAEKKSLISLPHLEKIYVRQTGR